MIEIRDLHKSYGAKQALRGVSFAVEKGEVVGLLGLNGAGKSTTMNILTGCLCATSGTVLIDGVDIAKDPLAAKRRIGYLPEVPPLYVDMQVSAYLQFVWELKGLRGGAAERRKQLAAVAEKTGTAAVQKRLIRNLSKGYRQRVGLAAALLGDPEILILDEPTVGLDPTQIIEIRDLIAHLGEQHTVILSSHILSEVAAVCGRVVVIDKGVVVADGAPAALEASLQDNSSRVAVIAGTPQQVKAALEGLPELVSVTPLRQTEPGVWEYALQGADGSDLRRPLFAALAAAQLPLLGARGAQVSLEDVFLQLVAPEQGRGAPPEKNTATGGEAQ